MNLGQMRFRRGDREGVAAPDTLRIWIWPSRDYPGPNDRGDRSRETSGRPGVQDLLAQSSGLAIGSAGRSKCEIPNGLGSEFCLWSIASSIRVQSHRRDIRPQVAPVCLCSIGHSAKKIGSMPVSGHCGAEFVGATGVSSNNPDDVPLLFV